MRLFLLSFKMLRSSINFLTEVEPSAAQRVNNHARWPANATLFRHPEAALTKESLFKLRT